MATSKVFRRSSRRDRRPRSPSRSPQKTWKPVLLGVAVCVLLGFFLIFRPVLGMAATAARAKHNYSSFKDAMFENQLDQMKEDLSALKKDTQKLRSQARSLVWVTTIPGLSGYYQDFNHFLEAAEHGVVVGEVFLEAFSPYASLLGFETELEQAAASEAGDKIAGFVQMMPTLVPYIDEIMNEIHLASVALGEVNPRRYPYSFRGNRIRARLELAQEVLAGMPELAPDIKRLLVLIPEALGTTTPRTYLIMFQNDKELRPTGGFWTAYALATFDEGELQDPVSTDIYELDERILEVVRPVPDAYARYLLVEEWYARDANIHPDFKASAETFEWFWAKDPNSVPFEGLITIDTQFLGALLDVLHGVRVPGYNDIEFTGENVVYELERFATDLLREQVGRKDLIGNLMQAIVKRLLTAPRNDWPRFLAAVVQEASEKHILFYLHDPELQGLAEKYYFAGRIRDTSGDYLHINNSALGGGKANLYLEEQVKKEVYQQGGRWISRVTADYRNPEPGDAWLNGIYQDWVRVYVPRGSELISSSPSNLMVYDEFGKTVFEGFIICDPKSSARLVVEYALPAGVVGDDYQLLIQKQPGTNAIPYEITFGEETTQVKLRTDKEIVFSL